ncbi:hypothetical protein [Planctomicrobium piriforme]|uniref:Carboxypeptidase regulatory-like domain-containing protein n=1 Tax=Planctomicrobium piriforme TaxID=1576369 RepID=A0A1I3B9L6_9PLAN|nr:hypothetical protein [Planctomicrobium piriforme]SFH58997.1 hypothetical protein SAMN05421753_101327 [Planctomicrobium piriforme]
MKFASFSIFLTLGLCISGCGSKAPQLPEYQVTGTVTFDGVPVDSGRILMREMGGSQRGYSGEIQAGQYLLKTGPGKMRVEITASRPVPGKFDNSNGTPEPVGEMYIPKKYNDASELTAEIQPDDKNVVPFELTAKKK